MKKLFLIVTMLLSFGFVKAQCNGLILKISDGKLQTYSQSGNWNSLITSDVIDFDCSKDVIIVVKSNGKLEKWGFDGNWKSLITTDAVKARINGDYIIVTKSNGKVEKWGFDGNWKGSL